MDSDNESVQSIHTDDENDLERVVEGAENDDGPIEVQRDQSDDEQKEEKKEVKPKRVIRNPQPKLNDQALTGPRGIASLERYFERVQFKGKGHEEKDLGVLLKTYEYWCHRLFPKFPFETCIEKIERLGHKKPVITHIKRIRYDLMLNEAINNDQVPESDEEATEDRNRGPVEEAQEQRFDNLVQTQRSPAPLTEEELERIRVNRERAEKLRRERLQKAKEKASIILSQEDGQRTTNEEAGSSNLDQIYVEMEKEICSNRDLIVDSQENIVISQNSNSIENIEEESVKIQKKKKIAIIESDESDNEEMTSKFSKFSQENETENAVSSQNSEQMTVSDQNDEDNLSNYTEMDVGETVKVPKKKKKITIIESDESDNEEVISELSKFNQENVIDIMSSRNSENLTISDQNDEDNLSNNGQMDVEIENGTETNKLSQDIRPEEINIELHEENDIDSVNSKNSENLTVLNQNDNEDMSNNCQMDLEIEKCTKNSELSQDSSSKNLDKEVQEETLE